KRAATTGLMKGINIAVDQLKKRGFDLEVIKYDSGTKGIGTRQAMLKLLQDPPDLILGEVYSSKAKIASDMAEQARRVMITPWATAPSVTAGKKYVFRTCFSDKLQSRKLAQFAYNSLKARRVAILKDASELYSQTLSKYFKKEF